MVNGGKSWLHNEGAYIRLQCARHQAHCCCFLDCDDYTGIYGQKASNNISYLNYNTGGRQRPTASIIVRSLTRVSGHDTWAHSDVVALERSVGVEGSLDGPREKGVRRCVPPCRSYGRWLQRGTPCVTESKRPAGWSILFR